MVMLAAESTRNDHKTVLSTRNKCAQTYLNDFPLSEQLYAKVSIPFPVLAVFLLLKQRNNSPIYVEYKWDWFSFCIICFPVHINMRLNCTSYKNLLNIFVFTAGIMTDLYQCVLSSQQTKYE